MPYLLDTNILICFFKNQGAVRQHMAQQRDTDIRLCTPVLWELLGGAYKSAQPQTQLLKLAALQGRLRIHDFDPPAAEKAARIRAQLEAQGSPIDTLIAGIALAHGLCLVTRNTREFGRVPGLQLVNWFDDGAASQPG